MTQFQKQKIKTNKNMAKFIIQNFADNSIIEVIAMKIDNENNLLIKEGNSVSIL